jgi:hypothetical protein
MNQTASSSQSGNDILANILALSDEIKKLPPAPRVTFRVSPYLTNMPRMTLSPNVPVTPAFRAEMNAWMLDFFGVEDAILQLTDPDSGEVTIFTTARMLERIKQEIGA